MRYIYKARPDGKVIIYDTHLNKQMPGTNARKPGPQVIKDAMHYNDLYAKWGEPDVWGDFRDPAVVAAYARKP